MGPQLGRLCKNIVLLLSGIHLNEAGNLGKGENDVLHKEKVVQGVEKVENHCFRGMVLKTNIIYATSN